MNGKETATQGKPLTQVVNEAIEAYLKNLSQESNFRLAINPKSKIDGSTATTRSPSQLQDQKIC